MPSYPIQPDKLLDAADLLAPPRAGRGRPPYTAHRRAISTAYYAVFHAMTANVAEAVFRSANDSTRQRIQRWIAHADVATVCRWVSTLHGEGSYGVPRHIRAVLEPPGEPVQVDSDTVTIADGFLELHDKRMEADYDHQAVFSRADTRGHIMSARSVVAVIANASSGEVELFLGLIGMQAQVRSR